MTTTLEDRIVAAVRFNWYLTIGQVHSLAKFEWGDKRFAPTLDRCIKKGLIRRVYGHGDYPTFICPGRTGPRKRPYATFKG